MQILAIEGAAQLYVCLIAAVAADVAAQFAAPARIGQLVDGVLMAAEIEIVYLPAGVGQPVKGTAAGNQGLIVVLLPAAVKLKMPHATALLIPEHAVEQYGGIAAVAVLFGIECHRSLWQVQMAQAHLPAITAAVHGELVLLALALPLQLLH